MPPQQPSRKTTPKQSFTAQTSGPAPTLHEIVDPVWLLKALALAALGAVVCAWLGLCFLYYQGSWQLVLHPSHNVDRTPASANIPFEDISFDAAETGQPRLRGWWIPAASPQTGADSAARYGADTILFLHDGTGSLASTVPALALMHTAGTNIFAFDYRGFGGSESAGHPNSETMTADAHAALNYLTATRYLSSSQIIPYGTGLGAPLALDLAQTDANLRAVILDNPDPDPRATAVAAHHSHVVPIRWLYHERFDIAVPLSRISTPKLLLAGGPNRVAGGPDGSRAPSDGPALGALFRSAASPRFSVVLPEQNFGPAYITALQRFLDQYLPQRGAPPPSAAR